MSILITVILYGRMIEIYCTVSIAPIPIATMSNREWGSIGTNYLKGCSRWHSKASSSWCALRSMPCSSTHDHRSQYPLGAILGGSLYGHSLLLHVQDRFACKGTIQCPLRKEGQLEEILRDLRRPSVAVQGLLKEGAWPLSGKPLPDHEP